MTSTAATFDSGLGLEPERLEDGVAKVHLLAEERHLNGHGTVHGGVIATLVDVAMGLAVFSTDEEARPVTIEMKVTYLEPGHLGDIVAEARVRKHGRRVSIVEAEVTQDDELIAHAISTFAN